MGPHGGSSIAAQPNLVANFIDGTSKSFEEVTSYAVMWRLTILRTKSNRQEQQQVQQQLACQVAWKAPMVYTIGFERDVFCKPARLEAIFK
ncbi:hypothetical protein CLCR_06476 [Cladophialophora carrionii]|uniref:Uncharacterized protein n=1 Tax=Cladophialophora carrionii TaxID=86049 RepID=A0A1C1C7A7_9EURO|nr:hypothetical protein CLCR_06476 [Cladophialophora carrionii]